MITKLCTNKIKLITRAVPPAVVSLSMDCMVSAKYEKAAVTDFNDCAKTTARRKHTIMNT